MDTTILVVEAYSNGFRSVIGAVIGLSLLLWLMYVCMKEGKNDREDI